MLQRRIAKVFAGVLFTGAALVLSPTFQPKQGETEGGRKHAAGTGFVPRKAVRAFDRLDTMWYPLV